MNRNEYVNYKERLFESLESLRTEEGLFRASNGQHYVQYTWWRDNFYACLPYLKNKPEKYVQSYHTYLDIFKKFERKYNKMSWMIAHPSEDGYRYIHPRIRVSTQDEIWEQKWQWKQNDATGYMLIGIAYGEKQGLNIIRDEEDREIIQLIIDYLISVRFWATADGGAWEENEELRSSSVGVATKSLELMKELGFNVPQKYIDYGRDSLDSLLPFETKTRICDLALLFLPFLNVTDKIQTQYILRNVEKYLTGKWGVKRYLSDRYYSTNQENPLGNEPYWIFGLDYLSSIYKNMGYDEIAKMYLDRVCDKWSDGIVPELVYAHSDTPNDNRNLAWTVAMTILAIDIYLENEFSINDVIHN